MKCMYINTSVQWREDVSFCQFYVMFLLTDGDFRQDFIKDKISAGQLWKHLTEQYLF